MNEIDSTKAYKAVYDAVQNKDSTIELSIPNVTESNAKFVTIEENTTQIEVPILNDPESDISLIATNLGLDSNNFTIIKENTTGEVTLTTTNDEGDTITIQITEINGANTINITPSTVTDTNDTNYDIVSAVNEATNSSYDSNDFIEKTPGTYIELNVDMENESKAEEAINLLSDTNDTNLGVTVSNSRVEDTYTPEPEPPSSLNMTLKQSDTTVSEDELLDIITEKTGTTVQNKTSYTMTLDTEIPTEDRVALVESIALNLDSTITVSSIVTELDIVSPWVTITKIVLENGDKVELSTDTQTGISSVIIFSNTVSESNAYEITNSSIENTDTTIITAPPTVTQPNATFVTVETQTSQVDVPKLSDPESDITSIATNLGLDSNTYTISKDYDTGKVTLETTNDAGETVTIEISEKDDKSIIKISPSTIADTNDTNYDIVYAVNQTTGSSYDTNNIDIIEPGIYIEMNIEVDGEGTASTALDKLKDTNDTNLNLEVEDSKIEEASEPEPEPTNTLNMTLKQDDTNASDNDLLNAISEKTGKTIQDKTSYSFTLDSEISTEDRDSFAQSLVTNIDSTSVVSSITTGNDVNSPWISVTTVVLENGDKVVLSTNEGITTIIIFSDTIVEDEAITSVNTVIENTNTNITPSTPVTTEPNATFVTVETETSQIEVPLLTNPEEDISLSLIHI